MTATASTALAPLITTLRDRCRRCYSCVRQCPAKAIRVHGGQAEVIPERCLSCGRCLQVCSQAAKRLTRAFPSLETSLTNPDPVERRDGGWPARY